MSLTYILSSSTHRELKDKLRKYFPRPTFALTGEILAEPQSENYALIGTAFDYLLRFHIERINKNYSKKGVKWIAAFALEKLKNRVEKRKKYKSENTGKEIDIIRHKQRTEQLNAIYLLAQTKFDEADENYNQFLKDGLLSEKLIISTIFLAKLDAYFRVGLLDDTMAEYDQYDIYDLKRLISIVPFSNFVATKKCYVNPTFGEGSMMVGGADADVIIDDTLYDFKVVKQLKLERKHLNQIIGYYVLSQIGGINKNKNEKPIKYIGIYFARHAIVLKFCIADFNTSDKIIEFIDWFQEYMKSDALRGFILQDFEKQLTIQRSPKIDRK